MDKAFILISLEPWVITGSWFQAIMMICRRVQSGTQTNSCQKGLLFVLSFEVQAPRIFIGVKCWMLTTFHIFAQKNGFSFVMVSFQTGRVGTNLQEWHVRRKKGLHFQFIVSDQSSMLWILEEKCKRISRTRPSPTAFRHMCRFMQKRVVVSLNLTWKSKSRLQSGHTMYLRQGTRVKGPSKLIF